MSLSGLPAKGRALHGDAQVPIPGGRTEVGTRRPLLQSDGEGLVKPVRLRAFRMDRHAVTNRQFARFVAATGHVTEAARLGWSFVFHLHLATPEAYPPVPGVEWWRSVDGATWDHPEGPGSDLDGREDLPVVQVSWNDAAAYAEWAGGRLPTEAEWEHAARGGLEDVIYPWGDAAPNDTDFMPCNIWQGTFPTTNTGADGHTGLAPAESFAPNGYGLFNMVGNCWEWTGDIFAIRSIKREAKTFNAENRREQQMLLKGGSFLCHASYCHRYRIAARIRNTRDTTTGHAGFRLVFDD